MATEDDYVEPITNKEKIRIVTEFMLRAPPGEFNEVFNDIRVLLNNDILLKEAADYQMVPHPPMVGVQGAKMMQTEQFQFHQSTSLVLKREGHLVQMINTISCGPSVVPLKWACGKYNKEQLIPVRIEGSQSQALVTEYNEIDKGYFYDPKSKQAFKYDHLRKEATDFQPIESDMYIEPWRVALDNLWTSYTKDHYKHGVCSVFGCNQQGDITLIACIEDHQFQPKNFWNGRWRSIWTITIPAGLGVADISGLVRVQVHYYEDGNVQLVSSKEIKDTITISNEAQMAKEFVQLVKEAENEYQMSVSDNYQTMSDTTFKALRRQLPVTHAKIDWNKMLSYRIGSELKHH